MNRNSIKIFTVLFSTFLLIGCQAQYASTDIPTSVKKNQETNKNPAGKGVPFTNGPNTTPPESVIGPSTPPPSNNVDNLNSGKADSVPAKAVTTSENIRITLPVKTD